MGILTNIRAERMIAAIAAERTFGSTWTRIRATLDELKIFNLNLLTVKIAYASILTSGIAARC